MLERYRRTLFELTMLLRRIECEPERVEILLTLQERLLQSISRAEQRLSLVQREAAILRKTLKAGRRERSETNAIRARIAKCEARIDVLRYAIFVFKAFGDGAAFVYIDKYALKHVYYRTEDYYPKQDAGRLRGKTGLRAELRILRDAIAHGVPAILSDLTNTIRHGDICLLGDTNPVLLEIKKSSVTGARQSRRVASLSALQSFLSLDEAADFRGLAKVVRRAFTIEEKNHYRAIADAIGECDVREFGANVPEPGLSYLVTSNPKVAERHIANFLRGEPTMLVLNEAKMGRQWAPCYPFTLSLVDPGQLFGFICGHFVIYVVVDREEVRRQFLERGYESIFTDDDHWALCIRQCGSPEVSAVSGQMVRRIFMEFQSLVWVVEMNLAFGEQMRAEIESQLDSISRSERRRNAPEWVEVEFEKLYGHR